MDEEEAVQQDAWMNRGVAGIGTASFLSDLGHEVPTALLPSFLTSTLGAPASALGLIEGSRTVLPARLVSRAVLPRMIPNADG